MQTTSDIDIAEGRRRGVVKRSILNPCREISEPTVVTVSESQRFHSHEPVARTEGGPSPMIGWNIWVSSPTPASPRSPTAFNSPYIFSSPLPSEGSVASTADWLAAWGQVGGAVFTALALAAALWINRRTRLALDDERVTRQQEIARLEADQRERTARALLTNVEEFIAAVLSFRLARRTSSNRLQASAMMILEGFVDLLGELSGISSDASQELDPKFTRRKPKSLRSRGGLQYWRQHTEWYAEAEVLSPKAALVRVSLTLSRLREVAHPDLLFRAGEVLQACEALDSIRLFQPLQGWKADRRIAGAVIRLQRHLASGPLLAS